MATITGLTAERMLEIEAASVIDGDIIDGHLILTKHDGSQVDAGLVIGPPGPEGPIGSDLEVLTEQTINDVGILGQIRAGRELELMDFEHLGLSAPLGLWNLQDLFDRSGHSRDLLEKGSVSQVRGINGLVDTAMQFNGLASDALYIPDTGVNDPFRIRTGSVAIWARTARQGAYQSLISKRSSAAGQYGYWLRFNTANTLSFGISSNGTIIFEINGISRVCDDRWHFLVGTFDGSLMELYVDGALEASRLTPGTLIHPSSAPFNIGSAGADATTASAEAHFGRADEAFITPEILTEDRIRNLMCAKIPHMLGVTPSRASLSVYPSCKGASLVSADFPAAYPPLRLYNFSAGSLASEGTQAPATLTDTGGPVTVAGVDGTKNNAFNFSGTAQRLTGSDTAPDLPKGNEALSYGCWVKTANGTATMYLITWGQTQLSTDVRLYIQAGKLFFGSGADAKDSGVFIADGDWHFVTVVQNNNAPDGVKRKLYLDGRLIATSTVLNPITLGGAGKFCIGTSLATASNFMGQLDTVFVCNVDLIFDEITKLYTKTLHEHRPSPKNAGDHIEAMDEEHLLVIFDTLDISNRVGIKVAA